MPFPWSGKRDPSEADGAELFEASNENAPADADPGDPSQLAEALGGLGKMLLEANQQITAFVARQQAEAGGTAAADLANRVEALAEKVDRLLSGPVPAARHGDLPPALPKSPALATPPVPGAQEDALRRIEQKLDALASARPAGGSSDAAALDRLQRQLDDGLAQLAERLAPAKKAAGGPARSADWERAIVGPVLAADAGLDFQRQQLVSGVLSGDPAACNFAGQLLVFQSATTERMPQLLKDIGEAYYRWQPKTRPGSNPMETALVNWLSGVCEKAGIGNTIELVHPGERFDSTRHTATTRGVEITEVGGWIVLRDNGKVYTKANVAAQ